MATVEFSAARIFAGTSANDGFNSEPILQTTYTLVYDAENRLVKVTWGSNSATFKYDGQGSRIKASITVGGTTTTTAYVGNYYELSGSTATKYYYAGAQMVAQRKGSALCTLFGDHLGSITVTEDSSGNVTFQGYYPWGGIRTGTSNALPTDNTFTDQKTIESIGLMFYNARYYDSYLNRWVQPDSIIPDIYNPLDLDRYSYVNNNPVNTSDPSGHCPWCVTGLIGGVIGAIAGFTLYAINTASSGQQFDVKDAVIASGGGLVAGALIGSGVGLVAEGAAALGVGATITSTGVGAAAGGGGYMAVNIATHQDFNAKDFTMSTAIGGATGAIGQSWATTVPRAIALNAGANMVQYEASSVLHSGQLAFDSGLATARFVGAVGGAIGGRWRTVPELEDLAPKWPYGRQLSYDAKKFPELGASAIWDMAKHSAPRSVLGTVVSNSPR